MTVSALVVSALMVGATGQVRYAANDERPLATPAPYPTNIVDSTERPGFNGQLWIDRAIVGGAPRQWPVGWGEPGPAHYGAPETFAPSVYVRRDVQVIGISPWLAIENENLYPLENARQFWLKEHGYIGGVRTFINPAVRQGVMDAEAPLAIEPRARFRAPAEAPKIRRRMDVRAPGRDLDGARMFLPDSAPIALRERQAGGPVIVMAD